MNQRQPPGRVKNPCRVCELTVANKGGIQCKGACARWAHYKCLGFTPQMILDIRDGKIDIICPCPHCNLKKLDEDLNKEWECKQVDGRCPVVGTVEPQKLRPSACEGPLGVLEPEWLQGREVCDPSTCDPPCHASSRQPTYGNTAARQYMAELQNTEPGQEVPVPIPVPIPAPIDPTDPTYVRHSIPNQDPLDPSVPITQDIPIPRSRAPTVQLPHTPIPNALTPTGGIPIPVPVPISGPNGTPVPRALTPTGQIPHTPIPNPDGVPIPNALTPTGGIPIPVPVPIPGPNGTPVPRALTPTGQIPHTPIPNALTPTGGIPIPVPVPVPIPGPNGTPVPRALTPTGQIANGIPVDNAMNPIVPTLYQGGVPVSDSRRRHEQQTKPQKIKKIPYKHKNYKYKVESKECKTPPLSRTPSEISLVSPDGTPKASRLVCDSAVCRDSACGAHGTCHVHIPQSGGGIDRDAPCVLDPNCVKHRKPIPMRANTRSKSPKPSDTQKPPKNTVKIEQALTNTPCRNCKCALGPTLSDFKCVSTMCSNKATTPKAPPASLKSATTCTENKSKSCTCLKMARNAENDTMRIQTVANTEIAEQIDRTRVASLSDSKLTGPGQSTILCAIDQLCATVGQLSGQIKMLMTRMSS